MALGVAGLLVLVLAVIPLGLLVWTLIDLLQRPQEAWTASGQDRMVWTIVVVLVGFIGPILYLAIARPRLHAIG